MLVDKNVAGQKADILTNGEGRVAMAKRRVLSKVHIFIPFAGSSLRVCKCVQVSIRFE